MKIWFVPLQPPFAVLAEGELFVLDGLPAGVVSAIAVVTFEVVSVFCSVVDVVDTAKVEHGGFATCCM